MPLPHAGHWQGYGHEQWHKTLLPSFSLPHSFAGNYGINPKGTGGGVWAGVNFVGKSSFFRHNLLCNLFIRR